MPKKLKHTRMAWAVIEPFAPDNHNDEPELWNSRADVRGAVKWRKANGFLPKSARVARVRVTVVEA